MSLSFFQNTVWSFINTLGVQLLALITNIILARLLYPEIFGILGMAMVFTGLILVIQDAGLNSYLIYKQNISHQIVSTTFWLNIGISIILSLIIFSVATPISHFYHMDEVKIIIEYIALGMVFGSLGITNRALLIKKKQFKTLTIIDMIAEFITSLVSIYLAINHFELLAISSRLVVRPFLHSSMLLMISGRDIVGRPSWYVIKEILPYSYRVLSTQIFIYFNNNIDYFLIGRLLGSKSLGIYTIAYQWSVLTRSYISGSVSKVAFPQISMIQNDLEKIRVTYMNIINKISFVTFPICIGLLIVSPEFIIVLYGNQWVETVPILQILLIYGMLTSIGNIRGTIFNGIGKPEINMWMNIASFISLSIIIYISSFYGLIAIALGMLLNLIILDYIQMYHLNKIIRLPNNKYWKSLLPSLVSTLIMGLIVLIARWTIYDFLPVVRLFIYIAVGVIAYICASYFFNRKNLKWFMHKILYKIVKVKE
jgi:O-antigen/teichoic acid export membrane protein